MSLDRLFNIAALIVGLAIIATLVSSANTARIITAIGRSFSGAINAAQSAPRR